MANSFLSALLPPYINGVTVLHGAPLLPRCSFVVLTLHRLKNFSITHLAILDVFQGALIQNE